jgi:hypothetical protein
MGVRILCALHRQTLYGSMIATNAVSVFEFDSQRRLSFGVLLMLSSPYFVGLLYH